MNPDQRARETFTLVAPPDGVGIFENQKTDDEGRWINYAEHPAYRDAIARTTFAQRLNAVTVFTRYFLLVVFKRLVAYELIPAHLRKSSPPGRVMHFIRSGLGRWFGTNRVQAVSPDDAGGTAGAIYRALKEQGICVIGPDQAGFTEILELVSPSVAQLRHLRGENNQGGRAFIESRATVLRGEKPDLFKAVESLFRDSGVLEAVSAYTGRPVSVVDINPQLNDKSDDFWRRVFPDMGGYSTDTAYFHRDASGGDVKAIIYLSDVSAENGPFTFVLGSHKHRPSGIVDWFGETNDHSGFSATDRKARQSFAALPALFRRKCAFGNDIKSDSDIARRIHAAEWEIAASRGHIVVFDTKGIHRGGMVRNGERVVLTCILG
jgi:ectoine hydroxylase-related dioxygenase (phytanoyl-CoA dioxygenase family)